MLGIDFVHDMQNLGYSYFDEVSGIIPNISILSNIRPYLSKNQNGSIISDATACLEQIGSQPWYKAWAVRCISCIQKCLVNSCHHFSFYKATASACGVQFEIANSVIPLHVSVYKQHSSDVTLRKYESFCTKQTSFTFQVHRETVYHHIRRKVLSRVLQLKLHRLAVFLRCSIFSLQFNYNL